MTTAIAFLICGIIGGALLGAWLILCVLIDMHNSLAKMLHITPKDEP